MRICVFSRVDVIIREREIGVIDTTLIEIVNLHIKLDRDLDK